MCVWGGYAGALRYRERTDSSKQPNPGQKKYISILCHYHYCLKPTIEISKFASIYFCEFLENKMYRNFKSVMSREIISRKLFGLSKTRKLKVTKNKKNSLTVFGYT